MASKSMLLLALLVGSLAFTSFATVSNRKLKSGLEDQKTSVHHRRGGTGGGDGPILRSGCGDCGEIGGGSGETGVGADSGAGVGLFAGGAEGGARGGGGGGRLVSGGRGGGLP